MEIIIAQVSPRAGKNNHYYTSIPNAYLQSQKNGAGNLGTFKLHSGKGGKHIFDVEFLDSCVVDKPTSPEATILGTSENTKPLLYLEAILERDIYITRCKVTSCITDSIGGPWECER